jgi:hypothetical protein
MKMEKQIEYFDAIVNTQKQVLNSLLGVQKDLRVQLVEGFGKVHAGFNIPGMPEAVRPVQNQINTWFSTMAVNTQAATEEALKIQGNWISAYEKQVAISRDILKSLIAFPVKGLVELASPVKTKAKAV